MSLVELDDMKSFLGVPALNTDYDVFLTLQLAVVSDAVEEYCNRKFSQATYTQTWYRNKMRDTDRNEIALYAYPLIEINTAIEKAEEGGTELPVVGYRFHKPTAKITKEYGEFFCNGEILEIEYVAGYAVIPALVQSVVYSVVEERYNKKKAGVDLNFGADVQRISIPGVVSIDYDYSLQSNERKSALGVILGNNLNILDSFRSERSVIGTGRLEYVV